MRITFVLLGVMWIALPGATASGQEPSSDDADSCIILQHFYHITPGKEDEAMAVRIETNRLRAELGLPTGRILKLISASEGHPAKGGMRPGTASVLMSETPFENRAAFERSNAKLAGSPAYIELRARMGGLLEHFEAVERTPIWGGCGE